MYKENYIEIIPILLGGKGSWDQEEYRFVPVGKELWRLRKIGVFVFFVFTVEFVKKQKIILIEVEKNWIIWIKKLHRREAKQLPQSYQKLKMYLGLQPRIPKSKANHLFYCMILPQHFWKCTKLFVDAISAKIQTL